MCEINHKTVFVLDHTQYFGISSKNLIDLDFVKVKHQVVHLYHQSVKVYGHVQLKHLLNIVELYGIYFLQEN